MILLIFSYLMRFSNMILYFVLFLFFLLFLIPCKEGFSSSPQLIESILLTKNLPVTKLQIEYAGALMTSREDSWINLNDLTLYDTKGKKVEYWKNGNRAEFLKGNKGYMNSWGPIEKLWDENGDTTAHSFVAPETLVVQLGNGYVNSVDLDSILITNRKDCCEKRIQNYNLVLYNTDEIIGSISLVHLGELGKTVKYKVLTPLKGPKGEKGDTGDVGRDGIRGQIGATGPPGMRGEPGPQGKDGLPGPIGDTNSVFNQIPLTDVFHSSSNSEKP